MAQSSSSNPIDGAPAAHSPPSPGPAIPEPEPTTGPAGPGPGDPEETQLIDDLRVVMGRRDQPAGSPWPGASRLEGTRLGQYLVERLLGEGGMAQVYRAVNTENGRAAAIKVLKPPYRTDRDICTRFEREAGSMARIRHENVVQILGFAEAGGIRAIVMELMTAGSLRRRLNQIKSKQLAMPIGEAVGLIAQAARGIGAAHDKGIVHRDVKPSNLLLQADGTLKVADFGAIHLVEQTTWLTGVGQQIGTPGYMSPEQCSGDRVTPASDVYSLGATLFELITGHPPFEVEEASPFAIMLKHVSEPAPDPRMQREGVPDWLASIVLKSLEKKPARRYATAGRFAAALLAGPAASAEARTAARKPAGWTTDVSLVRKQLQGLPHRAIVCWACRCARRVQYLNADPRVERALAMAEATAWEPQDAGAQHSVSRALSRIRALRAASLSAAYTDEGATASKSEAEAARSAAAAAACAAARCVEDAAADAAFAARSAITALESASQPAKRFWEVARNDYHRLRDAQLGQEGTVGRPIPPSFFKQDG